MAFVKNTKWPDLFHYSLNIKKDLLVIYSQQQTCTRSLLWVTGPDCVSDVLQVPDDSENSIFLKYNTSRCQHNRVPGTAGGTGPLMPSFHVLKRGRVTYLKIQRGTFSSMIIYIHTLKISVYLDKSCDLLQNEVHILCMNNLSFLDNGIKLSNLHLCSKH